MAAEIYSLRSGRKALVHKGRTPAPPIPDSFFVVAKCLGLPIPDRFVAFKLVRRRKGTEVWLIGPPDAPLQLNASAMMGIWPRSFASARQWISALAERYGWQMTERRRWRDA